MKCIRLFSSFTVMVLILLTAFTIYPVKAVNAQDEINRLIQQLIDKENQSTASSGMAIEDGAICRSIQDRTPVSPATHFSTPVDRLYCFTRITGARQPETIFHVWYHNGTERARIALPVNSSNWRTFSSKRIQPHETGPWQVAVLNSHGKRIETFGFEITTNP